MSYSCKVSVIIPVCNMAKNLDQTIASWTAQTLKDIEIICIDDGSSEASLRKLQEFAQKDNRIKVYSCPENKSAWCARKLGIEKACGEYIMFADAGDTALPETCKELYQEISASQVDILHFQTEIINAGSIPEKEFHDFLQCLSPYNGVLTGSAVFTGCFQKKLYKSYMLWDKIYSAEVCKKCLSDIQHLTLPTELYKLLYFMLSNNAGSYKGINSKPYYHHFWVRDEHNVLAKDQFKDFCQDTAMCVNTMESFLKAKGTDTQYNDILHTYHREFLENCVLQWLQAEEKDKASCFDLLLRYWRPEEVIGRIAELRFNETAVIAKYLKSAASLEYDKHPVKTIATHCHRITNGGLERVVCLLCRLWLDMGYKVILLTDDAPTSDDYDLPQGIERIVLPPSSPYSKRACALSQIIKEHHIDAVISHCWWAQCMLWDELAVKTAGAAYIMHHHNTFTKGLLEGWPHFDNKVVPFSLADAIVTLSAVFRDFWKYYNGNIHVTLNPLTKNLEEWKPANFHASHRILWLARLNSIKNPLDTIPIMQDVVKAVPDALLTIVGKSEDGSVEKQLQAQIAKLHLEENIKLAGFHTDVRPWYLASQIFLMTSSLEGYSMTLQECKMAGIPCVLYELPYLPLCEGNRGIMPVPQRDTKAAAQAIIKLLQDDTLCAQYGQDARAHIEEVAQFDLRGTWQQIIKSVEQTHDHHISKTEYLMMETLIAHHVTGLQVAKDVRDREIKGLKQGLDARDKDLDSRNLEIKQLKQQMNSRNKELDSRSCEIKQLKQELDSRNWEIHQLRHGSYIKRVARAVVPNRAKPYLKALLHHIPQGIKNSVKRLIRW